MITGFLRLSANQVRAHLCDHPSVVVNFSLFGFQDNASFLTIVKSDFHGGPLKDISKYLMTALFKCMNCHCFCFLCVCVCVLCVCLFFVTSFKASRSL